MSTIPGYDLEDYVMWLLDIKVENHSDANESLRIAELLGTSTRNRKILSEKQFEKLIELFEEYRNSVESGLLDYDEETQSWRDYAGFSMEDRIPDSVVNEAHKLINDIKLKEKLIKCVHDDEAEFIDEVHVHDDIFNLYFKFNEYRFSIPAYGNERWLMDEVEHVVIANKK